MSLPLNRRRYTHWWLDRCFLYVGRMTQNKGVSQILRAWIKLAQELNLECPPLWLIGGEPHEIEMMRRSADPDLLTSYEAGGRVKWWGYLDAPGISTLLLKAYVLVTHSLYEPGGRVMLEAMAQGIPVIATPHGFAADLITNWHSGFLVSYGDEDSLQRRMTHFALQPLLRHAMGRVAKQVASSALDQWGFLETHLHVYRCAIRGTAQALPKEAIHINIASAGIPIPRGFIGVYPFEGENVDKSGAAAFLSQQVGQADGELIELPKSGRSSLWAAYSNGRRMIIKHAFTTYKRRPMWDRGYFGSPVELQRLRVAGEMLAASFSGASRVIAADTERGLILRDWLEPAVFNESSLPACAGLLSRFHRSRHPSVNLEVICNRLDCDWHEMSDDDVLAELVSLDAGWRAEGRSWHAWRPMSVRLGWRWLKLGLSKGWLSLPVALKRRVNVWINEESEIAATAERGLSFGFCYGDADPEHLRVDDSGNIVLIDCERLHPGYFGHDWAGLVLRVLNDSPNDAAAAERLKRAQEAVESPLCTPRLLLSWLRWIVVMRLCRAHALMETEAVKYGLSRLRRIERLTSLGQDLSLLS